MEKSIPGPPHSGKELRILYQTWPSHLLQRYLDKVKYKVFYLTVFELDLQSLNISINSM